MNPPPILQVNKTGTFTGHRDCVYALAPAAVAHRFYSAAGDGLVVEWDLHQPDQGRVLARVGASVYALHHPPGEEHLWVGQNFDGLHRIDLDSRREIQSVRLTDSAIFDLQAHGLSLFAALGDGTVAVLDRAAGAVRRHIKASGKSARCLAVNPQAGHLAVGYSDHAIRIFDLATLQPVQVLAGHTNSVFTLAYSPDGHHLLSGGRDAHLRVWAVNDAYAPHLSVPAHLFALNHIAYRPDGRFFATASMDKSVKVWEAGTFRLRKVIDRGRHAGHGTSVNKLLWTDYHGRLVSGSDDRTLSVWAVDEPPPPAEKT